MAMPNTAAITTRICEGLNLLNFIQTNCRVGYFKMLRTWYKRIEIKHFVRRDVKASHHEEDPWCWDDEATVFVREGLVRLWFPRYGIYPLLLGIFGLKLGPYFILKPKTESKLIPLGQNSNKHAKKCFFLFKPFNIQSILGKSQSSDSI